MKLPRDLDGDRLAEALTAFGYRVTRQTGSHMRLTCTVPREHHITIPRHRPLRVGTLAAILSDIALEHGTTRSDIIEQLFS
jgi:predicted RNA binding protein YcfA (HicA-like mRNA interferase family)